ncbi:MAG: hypothetical protein O3A00_12840 [Planctomycetota bacterium]|nr:hypothetical protein [Planctomycetota bacterium]
MTIGIDGADLWGGSSHAANPNSPLDRWSIGDSPDPKVGRNFAVLVPDYFLFGKLFPHAS